MPIVSTLTTIILLTTVGTVYCLNCFDHMIYTPKYFDTYVLNIVKVLTLPLKTAKIFVSDKLT